MAHSNESNTCDSPFLTISNDLSYSFPQTSHCAINSPCFLELRLLAASQTLPRALHHLFMFGFGDSLFGQFLRVGLFIMRRNRNRLMALRAVDRVPTFTRRELL